MRGEPPTKRVKEDEEDEERYGRSEEYDVFKADPVKLEKEARANRKKQRLEAPVEEAPAQLLTTPY